jgi:hypothetical protein
MPFYNDDNNSIQGVAEEAISKGQCVKMGTVATNPQYVKIAGANEAGIGFAAEDIAAGATGRIIVAGVALALAHDNAITAGATYLKAAASGRVDGTTTDKQLVVAFALQSSTAQDDLIEVVVRGGPIPLSA